MSSRRLPPLNALRSFEAAARHLSFAGGADELFVTPAAVSHQIKRLETHLGITLFERHNRAVVLTLAGADLAATLHRLFAELDDSLSRLDGTPEPRIRINSLPSLAAKWLAPRLHRFEAAHPHLKVRIDASDHLVNFAYEPVDIGLRYGQGNYPGLHVEHLMAAPAFPVCGPRLSSRARPLGTFADLRRHTLLHDETSGESPGAAGWSSWLHAAGVAGKVDAAKGPVFSSIHLALEAALAGHGIAMGILPLVESDLRSGRLVRPFELELPNIFSFWIVCQRRRASQSGIRAFTSWLHSEASQGGDSKHLASKAD